MKTSWILSVMCALLSVLGLNARAEEPMNLFKRICSTCHGLDGKGQTVMGKRLGAKDLTQSKLADDAIEKTIREGKESAGQKKMPSFGEALSPDEIKALVEALRQLRKSS